MTIETVGSPLIWVVFSVVVLALLILDLGVFRRRDQQVSFRRSAGWTLAYLVLAGAFGLGVDGRFGSQLALEFYTGYLIELALSVDNLFVFYLLFTSFRIPSELQHRVLFWGIIGALILRALFIVLGAALLQRFHFVIYVFGGFLVWSGIRLLMKRGSEVHPENNVMVRFFSRTLRVTPELHGRHFFVVRDGRRWATPLLLVLVAIEATDVVFAVDSIPAIFGITTDPFIVYTSNIFAIMGLRSLYFVLSGLLGRFRYLPVGLALVLTFIGAKMLASQLMHVPTAISLAVVASLLGGSVVVSLLAPPRAPSLDQPSGRSGQRRLTS